MLQPEPLMSSGRMLFTNKQQFDCHGQWYYWGLHIRIDFLMFRQSLDVIFLDEACTWLKACAGAGTHSASDQVHWLLVAMLGKDKL